MIAKFISIVGPIPSQVGFFLVLIFKWGLPDEVFISEMGAQMQRGWWEFTT